MLSHQNLLIRKYSFSFSDCLISNHFVLGSLKNNDSVEVSTSEFIALVERFMSEERDEGVQKCAEQESEQYRIR